MKKQSLSSPADLQDYSQALAVTSFTHAMTAWPVTLWDQLRDITASEQAEESVYYSTLLKKARQAFEWYRNGPHSQFELQQYVRSLPSEIIYLQNHAFGGIFNQLKLGKSAEQICEQYNWFVRYSQRSEV